METLTEQKTNKLDLPPPYQLVQGRHGWMLCNLNDSYMGQAIAKYGECCELESQFLLNLASRGGMVVEVGANMGIHTVPLAQSLAVQGRKVLAFEPQRVIFQQLCANLAINGLTNVTALPYACGREAGVVTFEEPDYRQGGNFGGISMQASSSPARSSTVLVPCVRVDDVVNVEHVGLLKVDVEGFELKVLEGSVATIQRCRPLLYVENDRVDQSRDLIEWIWAAGYNLWWHVPWLFNQDNYFHVTENIYKTIASFNMLAIPREVPANINGMEPIHDSSFHPLAKAPRAGL